MKKILLGVLVLLSTLVYSQQKKFSLNWSSAKTLSTEGYNISVPNFLPQEHCSFNFNSGLNFVAQKNANIRTYERGVENETLSCGTGATACAIAMNLEDEFGYKNSCALKTKGGDLVVTYNRISEQEFTNVWLIGPAQFVYKGII